MSRNKAADVLKGYACLLVVFGHVIIGIRTSGGEIPLFMDTVEKFIWTFHIDLFMSLSGFVYSLTGGWRRHGTRLSFIGNKLLSLGLPYLIFSALYIAVNSLVPGVNNPSSLSDILILWSTPVAQYWFLYALFWLFVLWCVIPDKIPNAAKTAALYTIFIILRYFGISMGVFDSSMNCVLAFGLGTCLPSISVKKIPIFLRVSVLPLHVAVTVILIKVGAVGYIFVDDIVTVLGIFASVCFIDIISNLSPVQRTLDFICKYSFQIYLLHTFFTAAARIALYRFGITSYILNVAVGLAVGLIFPVIIGKAASRTPYLNWLFFPTRAFPQIKNGRVAGSGKA